MVARNFKASELGIWGVGSDHFWVTLLWDIRDDYRTFLGNNIRRTNGQEATWSSSKNSFGTILGIIAGVLLKIIVVLTMLDF